MAKKRAKKTVKSSPKRKKNDLDAKEAPIDDNKGNEFNGQEEVQRQSTAVRAIRDVETESLKTQLRLFRSYCNEEQLQMPLPQFFEEKLPNLSLIWNENHGQIDVQWKSGNPSLNHVNGSNIHTSFLNHRAMDHPNFASAVPSFGGFEFSSKAGSRWISVQTRLPGVNDVQEGDFVPNSCQTQMLGLQDTFQTPGVSSQRLSVRMTPKTVRLPKHGEILLSVHGSPLGVFKEDNMEAIYESEED